MSDSLYGWSRDLIRIVDTVRECPTRLRRMADLPTEGAPDERLTILVDIWEKLTGNEGANPSLSAASRLGQISKMQDRHVEKAYQDVLNSCQREIVRLLSAGGQSEKRVILTGDFGGNIFYITPSPYGSAAAVAPAVAGGWLCDLPPGHWLHKAIAPNECYQLDRGPAICLGPYGTNEMTDVKFPKLFYFLEPALRFTRLAEEARLEEVSRREYQKREKARQEQRRLELEPEYQVQKLLKRIAALEKAGDAKPGGKT